MGASFDFAQDRLCPYTNFAVKALDQSLAQFVQRKAARRRKAGRGAEHLRARKRLAFQAAGEFFNVDAKLAQSLGNVAHDPRPLVPKDVKPDET